MAEWWQHLEIAESMSDDEMGVMKRQEETAQDIIRRHEVGRGGPLSPRTDFNHGRQRPEHDRNGTAANGVRAVSVRFFLPLLVVLIAGTAPSFAQLAEQSPTEVVKARMQALNEHDLAAFLGTYADGVQVLIYPDTPLSSGKEHLSSIFAPLIAAKDVDVKVLSMLAADAYVVVDRVVSYGDVSEPGIAIYEVRDGLIQSVVFLRDTRRAQRIPREE